VQTATWVETTSTDELSQRTIILLHRHQWPFSLVTLLHNLLLPPL